METTGLARFDLCCVSNKRVCRFHQQREVKLGSGNEKKGRDFQNPSGVLKITSARAGLHVGLANVPFCFVFVIELLQRAKPSVTVQKQKLHKHTRTLTHT